MTRQEKALAGLGSVVAVSLFLTVAWSLAGGVAVLLVGLGACGVTLRYTHPSLAAARAAARADARPDPPGAASETATAPPPSGTAPSVEADDHDQA